MKKYLLLFLIMTSVSLWTSAQNSDSLFYCAIFQGYFGLTPEIFLYEDSDVIKIYDDSFQIVNNIYFKNEIGYSIDTVTNLKPLDSIINGFNEKLLINDFDNILLQTTTKILYTKEVDYIGDELIDKVEIIYKESKYYSSPYRIRLYENINGNLFLHELCNMSIDSKPLKFFLSKTRYLGMRNIILINEGEIPENSFQIQLFHADRYEKH